MPLSRQQITSVKSLAPGRLQGTAWSFTNPAWADQLDGHASPLPILPANAPYAARLHQRGQPAPLYTSEIRLGPFLEVVRYQELSELDVEEIVVRRLRMMLELDVSVLDLSARHVLLELGIDPDALREDDSFGLPQELAIVAASRDDVDAIRVPSAVHPGATRLAVFRKSVDACVRFLAEPVVVLVSLSTEEE
jgi:hypothetical protein